MSSMLTRMFAYFTVLSYLVVGTVAVRVLAPEMTTVSLSQSTLNLFSDTTLKTAEVESLEAPTMQFAEIKFPVEKKAHVARVPAKKAHKAPVIIGARWAKPAAHEAKREVVQVAKNELPFQEPVTLTKVDMNYELPTNLVALYTDFSFNQPEMVAEAMTTQDEIKTSQAQAIEPKEEIEADPTFFEYDKEEVVAEAKPETKAIEQKIPSTEEPAQLSHEEVAIDDLVAFDYSKAKADIKIQTSSASGTVATQVAPAVAQGTVSIKTVAKASSPKPAVPQMDKNALLAPKKAKALVTTHPSSVSIQIVGTDLKKSAPEVGFEVRFQDDLSEAYQDYNNGSVTLDQELSTETQTRSMTLLKRGFAPTNTDLIIEAGSSEVSLPLIEENTFNELLLPYEARGPIGVVLVELDDEVEGASLDVPYSKVLQLNGNLEVTSNSDFRYQMFVGVKAGNALLSYKSWNGEIVSKIIHIHEREVTFESNIFEDVRDEKVSLFEKDLLAKEKSPLIVASDSVHQFASNKTGRKLNDHTYKMDFRRTLLGGRRYLELTHQAEPVFVGMKNNTQIEVPSENFMRHILSRFEGSSLGNRCLVQVNLTKKASKVDVAAESVDTSIATYTQILDSDGRFYDSVSDKSEKVIVVGENQSSNQNAQDGKINVKVTYQDGSVDYLSSYCSPNTYLVEQL